MSNNAEHATFTGWAATTPGAPLERMSYDPGPLGAEDVEIAVEYCGICHSDQSMIDNEWGNARYPFIPGHEVVGTIVRLGEQARGLKLGQRVGIGWYKGSCMHCGSCMEGSHNLCRTVKPTIVGSHGGFADRLRSHWAWAVALPEGLDPALVGPLFCAGSTVFSPLLEFDIKPTDRVGVVGIGGLGHIAIKLLRAMGEAGRTVLFSSHVLEEVEQVLVLREVGRVEGVRVGHRVEDQPQLGEQVRHRLVHAGAPRQGAELLVEVDVGRTHPGPVGPVRGALPVGHGVTQW